MWRGRPGLLVQREEGARGLKYKDAFDGEQGFDRIFAIGQWRPAASVQSDPDDGTAFRDKIPASSTQIPVAEAWSGTGASHDRDWRS